MSGEEAGGENWPGFTITSDITDWLRYELTSENETAQYNYIQRWLKPKTKYRDTFTIGKRDFNIYINHISLQKWIPYRVQSILKPTRF